MVGAMLAIPRALSLAVFAIAIDAWSCNGSGDGSAPPADGSALADASLVCLPQFGADGGTLCHPTATDCGPGCEPIG
jgi:hypothetical protein